MPRGGKREGSGRKKRTTDLTKMEIRLSPELKAKAIAKAKKLGLSQNAYLLSLLEHDLR